MASGSAKYHGKLEKYFASKELYLDKGMKKISSRKIIELPWQYYCLNEPSKLLIFIKNFDIFFHLREYKDYRSYEEFIIKKTEGHDRINSIWLLFGLHIQNGEDFSSASWLLQDAYHLVIKDYGEFSKEIVKLMYWLGWARYKMDDEWGAAVWFIRVRDLILEYKIEECNDILEWCERGLRSNKAYYYLKRNDGY
jgi:hypothetical protein